MRDGNPDSAFGSTTLPKANLAAPTHGEFPGGSFRKSGEGPDEHHKTNPHVAATLKLFTGSAGVPPARCEREARDGPSTDEPSAKYDRGTALPLKCEVKRLNSTSLLPVYCDKLRSLDGSF